MRESMTPQQWFFSNDKGVSSLSIFYVMMDLIDGPRRCGGDFDIPHDASDFGRCYRLLSFIPGWRERIQEVGILLPKWKPLVDNWNDLEFIYENSSRKELDNKLKELYPQCMEADGWTRKSEYSYSRGKQHES